MSYLPDFPNFKHIEPEDKEAVEEITKQFPPYSDHNFISMLIWDHHGHNAIARLNDNLIIRLEDYLTDKPMYTFIGKNKISETVRTILSFCAQNQYKPELRLIPEVNIQMCHELYEEYTITEDRDHFDYVYDIPEVIGLKGSKYAVKRNFVNRFKKLYNSEDRVLDIRDPNVQQEILLLSKKWQLSQRKNEEEIASEREAIKNIIRYADKLSLLTVGLYVDNKMVGCTINEILNTGYAMNLFEHADTGHSGVFSYLRYVSAIHLAEHGCQFLNHQQDLGIEGLRKSKLSNRPKYFLRKYTITKKHFLKKFYPNSNIERHLRKVGLTSINKHRAQKHNADSDNFMD